MGLRVSFAAAALGSVVGLPAYAQTPPEPTRLLAVASPPLPPEPEEEELSLGWDERFSVIVSAERLLVAGPYSQNGELGEGGISFGALVFATSAADNTPAPFLPHLVPRLALDFVLGDAITVGALAGFGLAYGELPNTGSYAEDTPTPRADTYLLGARAGVMARVEEAMLWGRVGVSHAWASHVTESAYGDVTERSSRLTALDLEAVFVIPCAPHFGITLGFGADVALHGSIGELPPDDVEPPARTRRDSDGFVGWLGMSGFI
jgi:hypothetical protein